MSTTVRAPSTEAHTGRGAGAEHVADRARRVVQQHLAVDHRELPTRCELEAQVVDGLDRRRRVERELAHTLLLPARDARLVRLGVAAATARARTGRRCGDRASRPPPYAEAQPLHAARPRLVGPRLSRRPRVRCRT